jgi:hypothetical protein
VVSDLDHLHPIWSGSSLLGAGRLRFRIQIKVLRPGTQKHKGLDSLVAFTCEKPAYRVLYLISSLTVNTQPKRCQSFAIPTTDLYCSSFHQVLVLHMHIPIPSLVQTFFGFDREQETSLLFYTCLVFGSHASRLLQALLTHMRCSFRTRSTASMPPHK